MNRLYIVLTLVLISAKLHAQELNLRHNSVYGVKFTILDSISELQCDSFCSILSGTSKDCILLRVSVDSVLFNKGYEGLDSTSMKKAEFFLGGKPIGDEFRESCFRRSDSTLLTTSFIIMHKELYNGKCSVGGSYFAYSGNSCSKMLLTVLEVSDLALKNLMMEVLLF